MRNVWSDAKQNSADARPHPPGPFTILEPRDQEIGVCSSEFKRRATDFKAQKFVKGSIGHV